jgi:hypothetical protein
MEDLRFPSLRLLVAAFLKKAREVGPYETMRLALNRMMGRAVEWTPLARADADTLFSVDVEGVRARGKRKLRTTPLLMDASTVEENYPELIESEGRIMRYSFLPARKESRGLVVHFHGHNAHCQLGPAIGWEHFDLLSPWDTFGWNRQGSWFWGEKGVGFVEPIVQALIGRHRRAEQPWFCVGGSMGGFAALYHGIKYGCAGVYVQAPQVDLRAKVIEYGRDDRNNPYGYLQGETLESVPDLLALAEGQETLPPLFLVQNQYDSVNPFASHGFRLLAIYNRKHGWFGFRVYPSIGHGGDGSQHEAQLFFTRILDKAAPRRVDLPFLRS